MHLFKQKLGIKRHTAVDVMMGTFWVPGLLKACNRKPIENPGNSDRAHFYGFHPRQFPIYQRDFLR